MHYPRSMPPPVELFGVWRSTSGEGNCVEIAYGPEGWVAVRDSKDAGRGPILRSTAGEWASFNAGLLSGSLS